MIKEGCLKENSRFSQINLLQIIQFTTVFISGGLDLSIYYSNIWNSSPPQSADDALLTDLPPPGNIRNHTEYNPSAILRPLRVRVTKCNS